MLIYVLCTEPLIPKNRILFRHASRGNSDGSDWLVGARADLLPVMPDDVTGVDARFRVVGQASPSD